MDQRLSYFTYVRHDAVPDYLLLGWMIACDLGDYHGQFCVGMRWPCACRCVRPKRSY